MLRWKLNLSKDCLHLPASDEIGWKKAFAAPAFPKACQKPRARGASLHVSLRVGARRGATVRSPRRSHWKTLAARSMGWCSRRTGLLCLLPPGVCRLQKHLECTDEGPELSQSEHRHRTAEPCISCVPQARTAWTESRSESLNGEGSSQLFP